MVVGLQFELFCADLAATVSFWVTVLGFEAPDRSGVNGYTSLRSGPVEIGVCQRDGLPPGHHFRADRFASQAGVGVEIVLFVDDLDAAYDRATVALTAGSGQLEPLQDRPWGMRDFRVIDPDGYYVRVTSRG